MTLRRRTVLAAAGCLPAWPAAAADPRIGRDAELDTAPLRAYEAASGGRIGLYAENLVTGRTLSWRQDERFVMCSTFKASLAGLVLSRVDRGLDRLDEEISFSAADLLYHAPVAEQHLARGRLSVEAMCAAAVEVSDNTCANLLLAKVGGPARLTAFWRSLGDSVSRLDHDEPMLNRTPPGRVDDTTTPAAMAHSLRRLALGDALAMPSRQRLVGWLVASKTGFNRLRAGLPARWAVGDKTGNNGKDAAGDIAIAWPAPDVPLVICAYTRGGAPSSELFASTFERIGALVAQRLA